MSIRIPVDIDPRSSPCADQHRKRLLEAIAARGTALQRLGSDELKTLNTARLQAEPAAAPPPSRLGVDAKGERRHVTMIFCDLADSTGIAARLDAEEWRDLVRAYL